MSSGPSSSSSQPRLGPAWRSTSSGGRGFQPPPAAHAESHESSNRNSFSVLGAGDDDAAPPASKPSSSFGRAKSMPFASSRGDSGGGGGGSGASSSRTLKSRSGRSLADLAAQQQSSGMTRSHSSHATSGGGGGPISSAGERGGRRGSLASAFDDRASSSRGAGGGGSSILAAMAEEKNVIRYTREKLLSMRPRPDSSRSRPEALERILGGSALLSDTPLDPVCWDNFDASDIWQAAKQARGGTTKAPSARSLSDSRDNVDDRKSKGGPGRWQRGIALPPAEDSHRNGRSGGGGGGGRYDDADHPEDLWDDPVTPQAAAADFSAFGGSLDDEPRARNGSIGSDSAGFDLGAMSEMSKKFDQDIHGTTGSGSESLNTSIDPLRPLADAGTTIKSGSGDDVNVFEDFAPPEEARGEPAERSIRSGDEEQNASSRLMQMIGVTPDAKDGVEVKSSQANESAQQEAAQNMFSGGFSTSVPSNPWGDPIIPSHDATKQSSLGLDLSALTLQREQEEEEERRRLLEEKKQQQAQQEAELQRQQSLRTQQQQAQQQQQHEQVERILTERVSGILENSWGRCELTSILQTLHSEDPRVIPLLGTVDALRALLSRHPLRIRLAKDPTFGAEMAVLLMTNAQWQQRLNEETQRRQQEEQQKLLAQQQAAAAAKAKEAAELRAQEAKVENIVITDSPWFYADPQGNVQGPFGGDEMRQWLEAGYFKGDLPISQRSEGPFHKLSTLFPNLTIAFKPTEPVEEKKSVATAVEKEMAVPTEPEVEEKTKTEIKEKAVVETKTKTQEVANKAARNQNQSDQLKMLLGLGSTQEEKHPEKEVNIAGPPAETNKSSEPTVARENKIPQPQNKTSDSKVLKKVPEVASSTPAAPAWGGAGTGKSLGRKKSMSEIQREEAKVAARLAKERGSTNTNSSGGWANIAKSGGTTAWSGNAVVSSAKIPSTPAVSVPATSHPTNTSKQQVASVSQKQTISQRTSTQKTMEEFGANGKMTPSLESWCKDQMRKLSGNDDLTLVAFCMTLTDPAEIKQYLTAYLGSTPQVHSFASEFINRKSGNQKQEEWETTSSSKKGRKKKVGINSK